ncbi:MAG: hypothetical protein E7294_13540 [Lachnospiraceae bacterium]|nr:hypothetical protein [Lachnospiraceae bacterium]
MPLLSFRRCCSILRERAPVLPAISGLLRKVFCAIFKKTVMTRSWWRQER